MLVRAIALASIFVLFSQSERTFIDVLIEAAKIEDVFQAHRADLLVHTNPYQPNFYSSCLENPGALPELLKYACEASKLQAGVGLENFARGGNLDAQVKTVRNLDRFGGSLPIPLNLSDISKAFEAYFKQVAEDSFFFLKDMFPDLVVPDVIKFNRPLEISETKCHSRYLDFRGFPFSNTCRRVRRNRLRIPTKLYLAPPVIYRLPSIKFEATESLAYSRIFPQWVLHAPQLVQKLASNLFGLDFSELFYQTIDVTAAMLLTSRAASDLVSFNLWRDKVQARELGSDQFSNFESQELSLRLDASGRVFNNPETQAQMYKIFEMISHARKSMKRRYGAESLLADPLYLPVEKISTVGSLEFPLAGPITELVAEKILQEAGISNKILVVEVDLFGMVASVALGQFGAEIAALVEALNTLKQLMDFSDFLRLANTAKLAVESLSAGDYITVIISAIEADKIRRRGLGNVSITKLQEALRGLKEAYVRALDSLNQITDAASGFGAGIRVKIENAEHFCHSRELPSYYWNPAKASRADRHIQYFLETSGNPLDLVQKLNALVYSTGYPDLAVLGQDPLSFLKLHNEAKPLGDYFVNLSPEAFKVAISRDLYRVPEPSKRYVDLWFDHLSKGSFDDCLKFGFRGDGTLFIDPTKSQNKPGCAFGATIFKAGGNQVLTPYSPQAEIISLIRAGVGSFVSAPHIWLYDGKNGFDHPLLKKSVRDRADKLAREKTVFLPEDGFITRNQKRNLLPSCISYSELLQKDYDKLLQHQTHLRFPNETPNLYYVWTQRKCCFRGLRGPRYE